MSLRLVSHALCPYVQRVAIVLFEKDIPHQRVQIDLADKPDWFKAVSPLGKVPLLDVDGEVLFESAVICDFIEETTGEPRLYPTDPLQRARHRAWAELASAVLSDIAGFYAAPDAARFEAKRADLAAKLARVEAALGDGPWFAGERFGIVDAAFAPAFRYLDAFERIGAFGLSDAAPKLQAWRRRLASRPSVAAAVAPDYPQRLWAFLTARGSHLSAMMA